MKHTQYVRPQPADETKVAVKWSKRRNVDSQASGMHGVETHTIVRNASCGLGNISNSFDVVQRMWLHSAHDI